MGLRVEQAALIELAVHLDELVAKLAQQAGAYRHVVDEGAAAPVLGHRPAQNELAVGRDAVLGEQAPQPVAGSRLEGRR